MAMGLMPPDFLSSAIRLAPKRIGLTAGGHLPLRSVFTKEVIAVKKFDPDSAQFVKSVIC